MEIDKNKIRTQEDTGELAAMDQASERADAKIKLAEGNAKEQVADGLQDEKLAREAERLQKEAKRELREAGEGEA